MAQVQTGIRRVLNNPYLYQISQILVGSRPMYNRLVKTFLCLEVGQCLVDIGCGTGDVLSVLPQGVSYHGFDLSETYIAFARRRFGTRGTFWSGRVDETTIDRVPKCDAVLACGVLHHLDDKETERLFEIGHRALKLNGRLVTYDPCFTDDMSCWERRFVGADRGQNVRRPEEYASLATAYFDSVETEVLRGHLRIPYRAVVLVCQL